MVGAALALTAGRAEAQRVDENAVTSAEDAFGNSVGNEQVGLYGPFFARGFSPVQASNAFLLHRSSPAERRADERLLTTIQQRVPL